MSTNKKGSDVTHKHDEIIARDAVFAPRASTRIWLEESSEQNPYIAQNARCHGYDLLELTQQRSFIEVLYLLFRAELPNQDEARLLEQLMIALINPGPRHPAVRAAVNAGIGKTLPEHILPISLQVLGGEYLGAGSVEDAMRFVRSDVKKSPKEVAEALLETYSPPAEGDSNLVAGFGSYFGDIDLLTQRIADQLALLPGDHRALDWGCRFTAAIAKNKMGWLPQGLAAAVFCDLGFQPRAGAGLYQLLSAPGLLAHGVEYANKPITSLPRVSDEHYVIEP